MDSKEFEIAVDEWKACVISTMEHVDPEGSFTYVNTVEILKDIDKIVAKAFGRDPVLDD